MKKKILLSICLIALLSVVLVGCISKPPHKTFSDPWGDYEQITYDVTRTLGDTKYTGISTITTQRVNYADTDNKVTIGDRNLANFSGTVITIDTALNDGSTMFATVAFKSSFEPVASYKKIHITGHEGFSPNKDINQVSQIYYEDEKCKFSTNFDGVENSGELKTGKWIKKPFYDNLMLYHIARSSYLDNNFTAITTSVLSISDSKMKTLTASITEANQLKKIFDSSEEVIKADVVKLSLNQSFPGSGKPMEVTISKEPEAKDYCGITIPANRVPLIISEGDMVYKIKSFTSEAPKA